MGDDVARRLAIMKSFRCNLCHRFVGLLVSDSESSRIRRCIIYVIWVFKIYKISYKNHSSGGIIHSSKRARNVLFGFLLFQKLSGKSRVVMRVLPRTCISHQRLSGPWMPAVSIVLTGSASPSCCLWGILAECLSAVLRESRVTSMSVWRL